MKKKESEEEEEPRNFTPAMAIMDYVPVLCFLVGCVFVYLRTDRIIFLAGGIVSTIAGLFKATWKLIYSITKKDLTLFTKLFHILLPSGFVVMLISIPFAISEYKDLFINLFAMPAIIPSIIGCVGILMMTVFAFTLDSRKASSNWIEQTINSLSQIMFVVALCIMNHA